MAFLETVRRRVRGHLQNVAPAAFVQMIASERETCALVVREDGREGTLFFVSGELWDAQLGDWAGEAAAVRILSWDLADVETRNLAETPDRSIEAPLTFILLESMRQRDEGAWEDGPQPPAVPVPLLAGFFQELDGASGAFLIDFSSGRALEEHLADSPGFEPAEAVRACYELARADLALIGSPVQTARLEEIVLTWGDRLTVLRFLGTDLLLAVIADPGRSSLPAIHAALRRLAPLPPQGLSPWQE
ncbi:MAG TPA: DUF4388 domain-containing protein [Thermoanaerobaculia bacterium]|nr:DUF4388 domain-containing protein [Thermoanaerobaculia bacterium]